MIGRSARCRTGVARVRAPVPGGVAQKDAVIAGVPEMDDVRVSEVGVIGMFDVVMHIAVQRVRVLDRNLEMAVRRGDLYGADCGRWSRLPGGVRVRLLGGVAVLADDVRKRLV